MAHVADFIVLTILLAASLHISGATIERNIHRCPMNLRRNKYLKTFADQCYEFVNRERYFGEAQSDCLSRGGNLVQIRDSLTQSFVMYSLRSLKWNRNGVWIGATDSKTEGVWKWVTGDRVLYSNWDAGMPSCSMICANDCALLWYASGGKWHDKMCEFSLYHYSYICQYKMLPEPTTAPPSTTVTPSTTSTVVATTSTTTTTTTATSTTTTTTTSAPTTPPPTTTATTTLDTTISIATTPKFKTVATSRAFPRKQPISSTMSYIALMQGDTPIDTPPDVSLSMSTNRSSLSNEAFLTNSTASHDKGLGVYTHVSKSQRGPIHRKLPSKDEKSEATSHMQLDILIGGISGGLVVLALILVVLMVLYRKRKSLVGEHAYNVGFENPNYGEIKLRLRDDSLQPVFADDSASDVDENDVMLGGKTASSLTNLPNPDGFGTFHEPRI